MQTSERRAWIRIGLAQNVPPRTWGRLIERLGSPERLVRASRQVLAGALGPSRGRDVRRALDRVDVDAVLADAEAFGHEIATPDGTCWPTARFEGLADPPAVLFHQGPFPTDDDTTVALVGTRDASRYGLETARRLAEDLARRGIWIVSGFAVGVDAAAHSGALDGRGPTVGVLGAGLDVAYPVANSALRERLLGDGGTLVSEHPAGTRPTRWSFPRRNRLVAALADAVVVVEAPIRSGALITAGLAVDLHRETLAVPGHIQRHAQRGCHKLIKDGAAALCESAADVLHALGRETPARAARHAEPDPGPGLDVWRMLEPDSAHDVDSLCRATGLSPGALLSALGMLELQGFARKVPGAGYMRVG